MKHYRTRVYMVIFLFLTVSILPSPNYGYLLNGKTLTFQSFSNPFIVNFFDNKLFVPSKLNGKVDFGIINNSDSFLFHTKRGKDDLLYNFVNKSNAVSSTPKTVKSSSKETYFTDPKLTRGNALKFDGNDYVEATGYKGILGSVARTIEMWVRSSQSQDATLIEWGSNTSGGKWQLNRLANGTLQVNISGATIETNTNRHFVKVNDGQWHHIAVVLSGNTLNDVVFYVDGYYQLKSSSSSIINTRNGTNLHIGSTPAKTNNYHGEIDEVCIWNVARSQNEIRKNIHITHSGTETNLVNYWQFNESSGTTFTDVTRNNDLTRGDGADRNTFPAIRPSTAPVAGGTSSLQILNSNSGTADFPGTDVRITINSSPPISADMIVFKLITDDVSGNNPMTDIPALNNITPCYWIVRTYASFIFKYNMIFTLEPQAIATTDVATPSNLKLLSRKSTSLGSWNSFKSASFASQNPNEIGFYDFVPLVNDKLMIGTIGNSPLPIKLSSFKGVSQQGTNLLQWVTSSEINNDRFELLRSSDGLSYEVIGTVKGNGTTTIKQHYQYKDELPLYGKNYYRLRQIDIDGTSTLSETIVLLEQSYATFENKLDYVVYPNPIDKENISLRISSLDTQRSLKVSIYDVYGRMHFHKEYTADILHKDLTIDTAKNMESGIYLGIIQQGNQKVQHKIVIR